MEPVRAIEFGSRDHQGVRRMLDEASKTWTVKPLPPRYISRSSDAQLGGSALYAMTSSFSSEYSSQPK